MCDMCAFLSMCIGAPNSVGMVSSFLHTILGICNEDFTFVDTSKVSVFDGICVSGVIQVYIPLCKNLDIQAKSS